MKRISMNLFLVLCGFFIAVSIQCVQASDQPCIGSGAKYCQPSCPPCKVICKPTCEPETIKKHCWNVECDYVCIPPVKFPWTKCCDLPCPKIRKINVMKRCDYKIDICKFHWKLKKIWPCCDAPCIPE